MNDEQFIQRRMLLAAVLSAVVMGAYIYFAPRPQPGTDPAPAAQPAPVRAPAEPDQSAAAPAVEAADADFAAAAAETEFEAAEERRIVVESETYRVEFTNRGAAVTSWQLRRFSDAAGDPLDLVHERGAARFGGPFRLLRTGGDPIEGADDALFAISPGPSVRNAPETLTFRYSKDGLAILKRFSFEAGGHIVELETRVTEDGRPLRHLISWGGGFGDTAQAGNQAFSQTFYFADGDIEYVTASDADDERVTHVGAFPFVGISDLFFALAAIPPPGEDIRLETSAVEIIPRGADADSTQAYVAGAFGGGGQNRLDLFVGPKSRDALVEVQGLGRTFLGLVDYGFFSFLAEPLFAALRWVHANMVQNWGWSIVIVTVLINTILFPLKYKSTKSMRRMQQLQPLVKEINNRYKGVSMRDPRKAKQNQELQELYKKYNANPMGGCLPILLQMPFFFAFYKLLTVAIEMRQAEWLWVSDLSNPETLAIRVLPLAMVATQFWSQALTPTPTADPTQARIMKLMPLVFGFIFYQFQAGLVLYWLTSNVVGIVQQLALNRLPQEKLKIERAPRRRKRKRRGR
ncbi:MAG: membrane protein insertase YidC [Bryobacterales bacterium]|nr:membrane protein insertase YidC [Bryobacterales bacterium]